MSPTPLFHAVVWIDHQVARIVFVGLTGTDEVIVHSRHSGEHLHLPRHLVRCGLRIAARPY